MLAVINVLRSPDVIGFPSVIVTDVDEGLTTFEPLPISISLLSFNEIFTVASSAIAFLNVRLMDEILSEVPRFNPINVLVEKSDILNVPILFTSEGVSNEFPKLCVENITIPKIKNIKNPNTVNLISYHPNNHLVFFCQVFLLLQVHTLEHLPIV